MNKYTFFLLSTLYLILITMVITATASVTDYTVGSGVPSALETIQEGELSFSTAWSYIKIYFNILFFRIENFPPMLSLLIFHPLAFANGLILLDIIKDLIPFT